jgi:hypothetical protein
VALVTWFCKEAAGLTLGTYDDIKDPRLIKFKNGYAELDDQADYYPLQLQWIAGAANAYGIRCLGPSDAERRPFNPDDLSCPISVPTDVEAPDLMAGHYVRNQVACTFRAPTEQEISAHMLAVHAPKAGK